jgi:hypothetical protein
VNDSEVKMMVRCLIGSGSEQEKVAIIGAIGRGLWGGAKRLVTKPGELMKATKGPMAGQMVRGPRQFSMNRAMILGLGAAPGAMAGVSAAKSHPKAYRMNPGRLP